MAENRHDILHLRRAPHRAPSFHLPPTTTWPFRFGTAHIRPVPISPGAFLRTPSPYAHCLGACSALAAFHTRADGALHTHGLQAARRLHYPLLYLLPGAAWCSYLLFGVPPPLTVHLQHLVRFAWTVPPTASGYLPPCTTTHWRRTFLTTLHASSTACRISNHYKRWSASPG